MAKIELLDFKFNNNTFSSSIWEFIEIKKIDRINCYICRIKIKNEEFFCKSKNIESLFISLNFLLDSFISSEKFKSISDTESKEDKND